MAQGNHQAPLPLPHLSMMQTVITFSSSLKSELAVSSSDDGPADFGWVSTTGLISYGKGKEQYGRPGNHSGNR